MPWVHVDDLYCYGAWQPPKSYARPPSWHSPPSWHPPSKFATRPPLDDEDEDFWMPKVPSARRHSSERTVHVVHHYPQLYPEDIPRRPRPPRDFHTYRPTMRRYAPTYTPPYSYGYHHY